MADGDDVDEVETTLREAQRSLDGQLKKVESADRLAIDLFRIGIVFAGLLLTGLSLTVRSSDFAVQQFVNACSVFGIVTLWLALLSSAVTYTSSSVALGVSSTFIENSLDGEHDDETEIKSDIAEKYKRWIDENAGVVNFNRHLLTLTIIFSFAAVNFFSAGALVGLTGNRFAWLDIGLLLFSLFVSILAGLAIWFSQQAYLTASGS